MIAWSTSFLMIALLQGSDADLQTVAERSDFTATARYEEVVTLLDRISDRNESFVRASMGLSHEGRSLPLVICADKPIRNAAEARATGRPIVFAFGNIHAGEVCGKEALLMLARELALTPDDPLLEQLVIVLAPIYNADGNERVSRENRPGQVGPAEGMGQRANAQGLDLNRDYIKLESPEAKTLVRLLTEWDPHLTIDTHTTNGSRHRYALTYAAPLNPSGHAASIALVRDRLLPEVSLRMEQETGYRSFFYGNLGRSRDSWRTYSSRPRFGGPYRGLRGQMSILSEAYAYASYEDRIHVTLAFVREIMDWVAEHAEEVVAVRTLARSETIRAGATPQPDDLVGLRHRTAAFSKPVTILGLDDDDEPVEHRVVHLGRFEATRSVRRPHAYLIPAGLDDIVAKLRAHGIETRPFEGRVTVEAYVVDTLERATRRFEGHNLLTIEAEAAVTTRTFETGTTLVPLDQPLGTLAVVLLEPESDDGLAAWNFLDDRLEPGSEYPIYRVRDAADLTVAATAP